MPISAFGLGQDFSYNGMVSKICLLLWIHTYKNCRWSICHALFVPFLIFNMLVRSENRRISNIRMAKKSFDNVKQIHETLTLDEIKAAEEEYRETRTTTNPRVAYLLRELSAFGYGQHMSNEERLYDRRKIQSLCLQNGGNNAWFTINPNDLTNEINMKLTAFRGFSGREAEELFQKLQQHINSIQ